MSSDTRHHRHFFALPFNGGVGLAVPFRVPQNQCHTIRESSKAHGTSLIKKASIITRRLNFRHPQFLFNSTFHETRAAIMTDNQSSFQSFLLSVNTRRRVGRWEAELTSALAL